MDEENLDSRQVFIHSFFEENQTGRSSRTFFQVSFRLLVQKPLKGSSAHQRADMNKCLIGLLSALDIVVS